MSDRKWDGLRIRPVSFDAHAKQQPIAKSDKRKDTENLRYGEQEMRGEIERLRQAWRRYRKSRDRDAVYGFLARVFDLVMVWRKVGRAENRTVRALLSHSAAVDQEIEPFRDLIGLAAHPGRIDRRTAANTVCRGV